jgi:LysR family transcriptional regulator, hca operon transcriptional activator
MLPEPHTRALVYRRLRTEPLILVVPSDQRFAARQAIKLRQIKGEPFIKPSKTAPTLRQAIENSHERSGLDMKANHEVHNLAHAFDDRIDGRRNPAAGLCKETFLPSSAASLPIQGDAPMVDLVVGYCKTSASHSLNRFLAGVDDLIARA